MWGKVKSSAIGLAIIIERWRNMHPSHHGLHTSQFIVFELKVLVIISLVDSAYLAELLNMFQEDGIHLQVDGLENIF